MTEINRILLQLNRAVEFANSEYPQEKGMAVTLFDNIIEIQLYKRAEKAFMWDATTWYGGKRQFSKATQIKTLGYYDRLLKFAKNGKLINESDYEILKYAHTIRNSVYHKGELNNLEIDLAILIYYDFIKRTSVNWGSPNMFIGFTDSPDCKRIDFGQEFREEELLFDYKRYFDSALSEILAKINIRSSINENVQTILSKQMERIKWSLDFIISEAKTYNFYDVLGRFWYLNDDFFRYYQVGRKPKNIDSILILYAFLRENKDHLDDIGELKQRQRKGKNLLKKYRSQCKGKYPHWVNLERVENRIAKLKGKEVNVVLKNLIEIENKISHVYSDLNEAASDLDNYIQELIDRAKGK